MAWLPIRGATKWNTADRSDGAYRGVCMSARGAMKWERQNDLTGHAEGHACLSEKRRSEIRQTNLTGHAEGRACLSEEQHAENGAHHLNFLLLNHFSSNFVFVITYHHTARQIIEKPCHLLSHAVHNSTLTTLPQQRSDKVEYGRPIGRGMQRGAHVCQRSNMQRMVRIISIF